MQIQNEKRVEKYWLDMARMKYLDYHSISTTNIWNCQKFSEMKFQFIYWSLN